MATYKHTDGKGNITTREYGTSYAGGGSSGAPGVASAPVAAQDPFDYWQNAFKSINLPAPTNVAAPAVAPQQTSQEVSSIEPPVSETGDPGLDRYRSFLRDQFIDPDTIGLATIDRSQGFNTPQVSKMLVPTTAQQEHAMKLKDLDSAWENSMLRAAQTLNANDRPDLGKELVQKVKEFNIQRGSSFEDRIMYYLNKITAGGKRANKSNGFA